MRGLPSPPSRSPAPPAHRRASRVAPGSKAFPERPRGIRASRFSLVSRFGGAGCPDRDDGALPVELGAERGVLVVQRGDDGCRGFKTGPQVGALAGLLGEPGLQLAGFAVMLRLLGGSFPRRRDGGVPFGENGLGPVEGRVADACRRCARGFRRAGASSQPGGPGRCAARCCRGCSRVRLSEHGADILKFALQRGFPAGRDFGRLEKLEQGVFLGPPDGYVLGSDEAVGTAAGLAPVG